MGNNVNSVYNEVFLGNSNKALGGFRLVHYRVNKNTCDLIDLNGLFKMKRTVTTNEKEECIGKYSEDNQQKTDYPNF